MRPMRRAGLLELVRKFSDRGDALASHPSCAWNLEGVRARWDELGRATRTDVARLGGELADWVETFYVGLTRVRERGFDPVAALRRARRVRDIERAFAWLGDRHTFVSFRKGGGGAGSEGPLDTVGTLQLPVRVGSASSPEGEQGPERYWIAEVAGSARVATAALPRRGDEVTHWNGVPVERVVRRLGTDLRGAHSHARRRLGLRALTRRVVEAGRLPEEDWVVLTCRHGGRRVHHRLEWSDRPLLWPSRSASILKFDRGDRVQIGHFGEPDEMLDLLEQLRAQRVSARPLMLDLRGNGGGSVHGMLAVFLAVTGRCAVDRLRFQFRASERLPEGLAGPCRLPGSSDGFSAPHPIDRFVSVSGPLDHGPSVVEKQERQARSRSRTRRKIGVLVDASTFSAAEILTALLRSEGATVFGTDPCTGDGPDNAWSLAALRRLSPDGWIAVDGSADLEEMVRGFGECHGLRVSASWIEGGSRHWRLGAQVTDSRSHAAPCLAVWNPELHPDGIAVHTIECGLGSAAGLGLDLHLAVRRPLILLEGAWVPVERQDVDHLLRPSVRDLLEDDADLLETAFHLLAGDARVARSGSETPASSDH